MASTSYLQNAPLKDKMPESWDVEVCHEGEADLYKHHKSCQKHPDHKEFISVDTFDITHLPTDYQDRDIVEYIKLVAQLTVRLTVRYVSLNRPATVPGTETPYPFYENRGQNFMRVGTGIITDVRAACITIKTAAHVVYDGYESVHTSCHLFYDNGDQPAVCNTAVEVKGYYRLFGSNSIVDETLLLVFISLDEQVAQTIPPIFLKMLGLRTKILNRLSERSYASQNQPLTFIVSHPHGCSKKISIGRCVEVDDNLDDVRFLYTTPTCPGSSGAAVICLDKQGLNLKSIHSGPWKDDASLNLGSGRYIPFATPSPPRCRRRKEFEDRRLPDSECNVCCPLPRELNYNLMYDYINMLSYLCFDIDVNYVSKKRPKFWPGSELPYPWYKKRGSREERRGCGWVDRVVIYPNESSPNKTCDCDTCWNSLTPEKNFAHIYILTSTSHVFDQIEGLQTTCYADCEELENLSGTQPVSSDVETDRSQLVFVTHDLKFADQLNIFLEHHSFLKEKIQDKLFSHLSANPVCIKIGRWHSPTIGRCVRVDKYLVYTNENGQDDVGAPIIVLVNKHSHVDVSGHTGQHPHDSKLGYSRYLYYQYK